MKLLVHFSLLALVVCEFSSRFDNINVDEILGSDRLLNNYFKCLMDKGPCTPDAGELKKALPEALKSTCAQCSDRQKDTIRKIVSFLEQKKPDMWKALTGKYDPQGEYYGKFKAEFGL